MTNLAKIISTSVALIIFASSAAQAHHNVRKCGAKVFSEYNCGDDVYLPNTPAAQCWNDSNNALDQCKKFHSKYSLKRPEFKNPSNFNAGTNRTIPAKKYQLKKVP